MAIRGDRRRASASTGTLALVICITLHGHRRPRLYREARLARNISGRPERGAIQQIAPRVRLRIAKGSSDSFPHNASSCFKYPRGVRGADSPSPRGGAAPKIRLALLTQGERQNLPNASGANFESAGSCMCWKRCGEAKTSRRKNFTDAQRNSGDAPNVSKPK